MIAQLRSTLSFIAFIRLKEPGIMVDRGKIASCNGHYSRNRKRETAREFINRSTGTRWILDRATFFETGSALRRCPATASHLSRYFDSCFRPVSNHSKLSPPLYLCFAIRLLSRSSLRRTWLVAQPLSLIVAIVGIHPTLTMSGIEGNREITRWNVSCTKTRFTPVKF